jgi:hypothetical protein
MNWSVKKGDTLPTDESVFVVIRVDVHSSFLLKFEFIGFTYVSHTEAERLMVWLAYI